MVDPKGLDALRALLLRRGPVRWAWARRLAFDDCWSLLTEQAGARGLELLARSELDEWRPGAEAYELLYRVARAAFRRYYESCSETAWDLHAAVDAAAEKGRRSAAKRAEKLSPQQRIVDETAAALGLQNQLMARGTATAIADRLVRSGRNAKATPSNVRKCILAIIAKRSPRAEPF